MESRGEKAKRLFQTEHYNCSQSVVLTFDDLLEQDRDSLAKVAAAFGGGIGGLHEVCGAVTGMAIVVGLLYGYSAPVEQETKMEFYNRVNGLATLFKDEFGTYLCREIKENEGLSCETCVVKAAELLEKFIEAHPL